MIVQENPNEMVAGRDFAINRSTRGAPTGASSSIEFPDCTSSWLPTRPLHLRANSLRQPRAEDIVKSASSRQVARGLFVCCEPRSSVFQRAVAARKRNRQLVQRRMHLARGPGSSLSIPPPETQPLDPLPPPVSHSPIPARRDTSGRRTTRV